VFGFKIAEQTKTLFMKLIITSLISCLLFSPDSILVEKWIVEKSSNLCIEGKSNVSVFRCDIIEYLHSDTIRFFKDEQQNQFLNIKGGITIDINRFDCHQKYITGDLRKTLKADKNPLLKINLISIGDFTNESNKNIKGIVSISLAGVTKQMDVAYKIVNNGDGNLNLYGSRGVLFSDFMLTPPNKLAGLIKVENELQIQFRLNLRSVQPK